MTINNIEQLKNEILEICNIEGVEDRKNAVNDLFDNKCKNTTLMTFSPARSVHEFLVQDGIFLKYCDGIDLTLLNKNSDKDV